MNDAHGIKTLLADLSEELSIGYDGNLRSGYDQPETRFMDDEGNETPDERWASGERVGQPLTGSERRAIADQQIARWLEWSQRPANTSECSHRSVAGQLTRYRCILAWLAS